MRESVDEAGQFISGSLSCRQEEDNRGALALGELLNESALPRATPAPHEDQGASPRPPDDLEILPENPKLTGPTHELGRLVGYGSRGYHDVILSRQDTMLKR